jgi:hypothetical protein
MSYTPTPIDTSDVTLPREVHELIETMAKNTHDVWARQRLSEGWCYGPERDDTQMTHPGLVPYEDLPEPEKEYDRFTATETLKLIVALGYSLRPSSTL